MRERASRQFIGRTPRISFYSLSKITTASDEKEKSYSVEEKLGAMRGLQYIPDPLPTS